MSLVNTVDGLCLRDLALYFSHNFLRCANGKTPLGKQEREICIWPRSIPLRIYKCISCKLKVKK